MKNDNVTTVEDALRRWGRFIAFENWVPYQMQQKRAGSVEGRYKPSETTGQESLEDKVKKDIDFSMIDVIEGFYCRQPYMVQSVMHLNYVWRFKQYQHMKYKERIKAISEKLRLSVEDTENIILRLQQRLKNDFEKQNIHLHV